MNNQFLYIGINADNIEYKPMIRILRDATNDPIFIATSKYFMEDAGEAYALGVDLYGQAGGTPEANYNAVRRKINGLNIRSNLRKPQLKIMTFDDILYVPAYHKVFIKDTELKLVRIELKILAYMLDNPSKILTHDLICRKFLKVENSGTSPDTIYNLIKRLRKKMKDIAQFDYIKTVRDIGYCLVTRNNHTG